MSSTPTLPDPADRASQRDEDTQYYRQVLHELIEIGTDLARALHRQAAPESNNQPNSASSAEPASDPTIAFDRIARTLRRTIALARKLTDPAPPRAAERRADRSNECRLAARKQIIREVEDTIQRRSNGAEALHAEFYERLDDPDLDDDLDQRPVAEIIKDICRDFGIEHFPGTHPWKRRTPQDVRDLCARAARPSLAQPRSAQPGTVLPHPFSAPPPRTPTSTGPPRP